MKAILPLGVFTPGFWEIFLILAILLVLFGARKLPLLARGLGAGVRNFKGELRKPPEEDAE